MSVGRSSTYKRCGCRETGSRRELGAECPRLGRRGHGSWYLLLDLGRDAAGHRVRVRRGGFASRAAALDQLTRLGTRAAAGGDLGCAVTTGQWLRRWLAGRQRIRASTLRGYRGHVERYLLPGLGRIPLAELAAADVRRLFASITVAGERSGRAVSAATQTRIRATLRAALNAALREGLVATNVARLVELPPPPKPRPVIWTEARVAAWRRTGVRPAVAVWTAEQTAAFLSAVADDPLFPLFRLIALRGLRRGEAAGLGWSELDLDAGTLAVAQQLLEFDGRRVLVPPKSAASVRIIALDAETTAVLRRHRDRQLAHRLRMGRHYRDHGFVFAAPNGEPLHPDNLTRRFRRLVTQAGLPPVRLHDLRHGAATLTLAAGADLKVVQDLLGHSTIVLTADTYTSVLPEVHRQAAEATARLVTQAGRRRPGRTWSASKAG